jgi:hypothetical protein
MRIYLLLILMVIFSSCVRNKNGQTLQNASPSVNSKVFEVTEVVQTSNYTYLKVKENMGDKWVAVSRQDINVGDVYYYDDALQMNNFHSKELERDFDVIYFVNQISKTPMNQTPQNAMTGQMPAHSGKVQTEQNSNITLKKAGNELTVAQIYASRDKYANQEVEIRGVVVKVNKSVMGKNWIHIQDGTNDNGNFDLTITSQDVAEVNDEVTFKGKITLNKDFGAGYFYEVIMEDAVLENKSTASL